MRRDAAAVLPSLTVIHATSPAISTSPPDRAQTSSKRAPVTAITITTAASSGRLAFVAPTAARKAPASSSVKGRRFSPPSAKTPLLRGLGGFSPAQGMCWFSG